MSDPGVITSLS